VPGGFMRVDRPMYKWTDIMKLIFAFHNVANTCNKLITLIVCRMYSMASEFKMPENVYCTWGLHFHTSLWEESCPSLLNHLPCFSTRYHLDLLSKDVTAVYREAVHCEHCLVTLLAVPVLSFPCGRCRGGRRDSPRCNDEHSALTPTTGFSVC